jgi:flagellar M-ring protein FliF
MNWSDQLRQVWTNMAALGSRRLGVLGLVGLTVFVTVALGSYYVSRPDYSPLYVGLNSQDVGRIGAALQEAGIPFDVNSEGTSILVNPSQAAHARMLLAEKGLPSSASAGYELFDKMGAIGLTSFMQEITRVRALEGELARTIQGMKGVRAARVHIVMADNGSFRRNNQEPSASVVIRTDSQGDFSSAQAIRHLVAAAIPGMGIAKVRVLSTDGTILASGDSEIDAAPTRMLDLENTVAREMKENVRKTLAPYIGLDNFELSVSARLNIDKRQINETNFDPDSRFERSRRTVKETTNSQDAGTHRPAGVDQNLPDQGAASGASDTSSRSVNRKEELKNFEANSKTVSTVSEGYRIEALTIAVVVNRERLKELLGDKASPDAIDAKLKEVEGLVASATGSDAKRGDRITVAAVQFLPTNQALQPVPSAGMFELAMQKMDAVLKALALLAATIILVWFGLRPATRMLLEAPASVPASPDGPSHELPFEPRPGFAGNAPPMPQMPQMSPMPQFAGEMPGGMPGMPMFAGEQYAVEPAPNLIGDLTSKINRTPQKRLEQIVEFDEDQAVAILKQWLREGVAA